jgi:drug/metabolite transporter (DMT)-like permease
MNRQKLAYVYAILAVLLWSTVASAFKLTLQYLDVISMLFLASLASLVLLFGILIAQGKLLLLTRYSRQDFLYSLLLGALNPFFYYIVLFKAYSLLPAQEAQPLNQIWALILPLFSVIFLRQRIRLKSVFALIVSFLGVLVIVTHGNPFSLSFSCPIGSLLAIGSAFIWALFWIGNLKDTKEEVSKLFLNFLFGFFYIVVAQLIQGGFQVPPVWGLAGAIYIGFFEMGITFIFWMKALQLSETTAKITNIVYFVPFLSLMIITITVGEVILWSTVIGLVMIIGGNVLQQ